jgi:hypothetical protein
MAKKLYGWTQEDLRKQEAYNQRTRGRGGSTQRQRVKQRRNPGGRGGPPGDSIYCAKLILDVPERTVIEDACIIEVWTGSWYDDLLEDDDETPVKWAVINRTNFPFQAGLLSGPLMPGPPVVYVWGRKRMKDDFVLVDELGEPILDDEDEIQYVTKPCLEVFSPNLDMTILSGYAYTPDNGVGQVPVSKHGSNTTVADGGPCGVVDEEP